jgi:hypothetical protein
MPARDWKLPANLPLCFYADQFHRTAQDAIFSQLTDTTTPEQFAEAHATLCQLREEVEQDMPPIHYASQFGTHICVGVLYKEATLRLWGFSQLQQASQPPAPTQPPLTREEVLDIFEKNLPAETFFGEERTE